MNVHGGHLVGRVIRVAGKGDSHSIVVDLARCSHHVGELPVKNIESPPCTPLPVVAGLALGIVDEVVVKALAEGYSEANAQLCNAVDVRLESNELTMNWEGHTYTKAVFR